jgi:hypothetical protein
MVEFFLTANAAGSPRYGGQALGSDRLVATLADAIGAVLDALEQLLPSRRIWGSKKWSRRRDRLGRIHMWND